MDDETDLFEKIKDLENVLNQHTFQLDEIRSHLSLAEKRKSILLSLEEKVDDNMKRLNAMMLELKGIVAIVRPQVKKSGWYGDELKSDVKQNVINLEVKYLE